jgi:hypothetical protein
LLASVQKYLVPVCAAALMTATACGARRGDASRVPDFPPPLYHAGPQERTIPAGQSITLTSVDSIDNEFKGARPISAVVSRDVLNQDGRVVISAGSPAELLLWADGEYRFALRSVMVNGNLYWVAPAGASASLPQEGALLGKPSSHLRPDGIAQEAPRAGKGDLPPGTVLAFSLPEPFRLELSGNARQDFPKQP